MILRIENISKSFNGVNAVDDFSCSLEEGKITGLIGPNGAGKTTLFNMLTGFLQPDKGSIVFDGEKINNDAAHNITNAGIVRTFQEIRLIKELTALENILLYFENQPGENLFNIYFRKKYFSSIEKKNNVKAIELLEFAGIKDKAESQAGNLSYGQQKLLSICCCLAAEPKLILLDEPVSGIQPAMIEKISAMIKQLVDEQRKTIFFIEHDMEFVFNNCSKVIVMDHGKKIAEDIPEKIKSDENILEVYLS